MSLIPPAISDLLTKARPRAPYPGLRPFEAEEWSIFFGREQMIDDVIDRLALGEDAGLVTRDRPHANAAVEARRHGEVLVGQSAKRQAVTNPQNTLAAVKRLIGRKFTDDVVKKDMSMVSYKVVKADNGDAWVEVQDKKMAPPEVSA